MKSGSIPAKANVSLQKSFYDTVLQPLMSEAVKNKLTLLFLDASHFVMGCDFLGYLYGKARKFIKTFSGRKRYNVLDALNYVTKKITTISNDTYITAGSVCEMLRKIALEYVGKPVHIVLDNARYGEGEARRALLHQYGCKHYATLPCRWVINRRLTARNY